MNTMHYSGYDAVIAYDEVAAIFHGEVVNLRDVITFQGDSVDSLKAALAASIEDYFMFCKERGEATEKPHAGPVFVPVEPPLHNAIVVAAERAGLTVDRWVAEILKRAAT